jgi:hypothetical protein
MAGWRKRKGPSASGPRNRTPPAEVDRRQGEAGAGPQSTPVTLPL